MPPNELVNCEVLPPNPPKEEPPPKPEPVVEQHNHVHIGKENIATIEIDPASGFSIPSHHWIHGLFVSLGIPTLNFVSAFFGWSSKSASPLIHVLTRHLRVLFGAAMLVVAI